MRKRRAFYTTNMVVLSILVLSILSVINYIAFKNSSRVDLTREKLHSLSDQTIRVLKGLRDEVEIIAFFKEIGLDRKEFQNLINQYKSNSPRIKVRFVDPDHDPGIAQKYQISEYGTLVFRMNEKTIKIKISDPLTGGILNTSEQLITNSLIKLTKDIEKTVLFLTGHGERDINDIANPAGFGRARRALEDESFIPREFVLLREGKIPSDSILVVAAPKKPLLEAEVQAIKEHLDGGGAALFLLEPNTGAELVELLSNYGIDFRNDVIIDPSSKLVGGGDVAPIIATYSASDITEDFRFATIFPYSRSVNVRSLNGVAAQVIAKTSEYAWAEKNLKLFGEGVAELDAEDEKGPLGVAAVSELGDKGRIAGFGSADVISNRFFDFSGNGDLFLNTINWLARDENLISIRPKLAREGKLDLTPSGQRVLFAVSVVAIPLAVLITGTFIWFKRRNR